MRVSTSTTHPAMANLLRSLFEPFGPVYQVPRYKKDTKSYEWNLSTILDISFDFLLQERVGVWRWLASHDGLTLAYLAGLLDAEGSVVTTRNARGDILLFVTWSNSDLELLRWVRGRLRHLGYPTSLCLNKRQGVKSKKYGIIHRRDYWQLSIFGIPRVQEFLRRIFPKHSEKVRRVRIALSVRKAERYSDVLQELTQLRAEIKEDVKPFVKKAESVYLSTHPAVNCANPSNSQCA